MGCGEGTELLEKIFIKDTVMNLVSKTWFHALIWMVVDFLVFAAAYLLAVLFNNDFHVMHDAQGRIAYTMAFFFSWKFWLLALLQPIFFLLCRIYRKIWGYANFRDIVILCFYCAVYCLFFAVICETLLADLKLILLLYIPSVQRAEITRMILRDPRPWFSAL